jgi:hypothetical protein
MNKDVQLSQRITSCNPSHVVIRIPRHTRGTSGRVNGGENARPDFD